MSLRGWLIGETIVFLPPACVGACAVHDDLLASRFQDVAVGMSHQEVIKILGRPRYTEDCKAPGPFKPWQRPDCAETYVYPSLGQPLVPSAWVVWFNTEGKVIDRYRFVSW